MCPGKLNLTPTCPDRNTHYKVNVWFTTTFDDGVTDSVASPEKYLITNYLLISY